MRFDGYGFCLCVAPTCVNGGCGLEILAGRERILRHCSLGGRKSFNMETWDVVHKTTFLKDGKGLHNGFVG